LFSGGAGGKHACGFAVALLTCRCSAAVQKTSWIQQAHLVVHQLLQEALQRQE
jgi:hypothetical protein